MNSTDGERPEEQLADELAAYHDRLAGGRDTAADEGSGAIDPTLLPEWNRLAAFLAIMEKAWPRTEPELDHPWRPVLAGEPLSREGPEPDAPAAERRRLFGRFQVLRTLGQGGFGIVFLAWDPALRRQVALKLPQPESLMTPEARKRFQREAHAAAGLDHPNIVPIYESGAVDTVAYIASAYVPGPTLALWLASQTQPVPERDAAKLVATLARAVEHAHERGVLHRDLKPNNILLQHPGDEDPIDFVKCALAELEPRIVDFSLARLADYDGPKTVSGFPIGSPPYMAPEQAEGRPKAIGPPTDVYGLGGMLYELLTGRPPFEGESQIETIRHVIHDDPLPPRQLRKEVSPALEAIVLKCLEKNPTRRYPTARELAEDMERFLAGEPVRARPSGHWKKIGRLAKRRRVAIAMVIIGVAAAATLLGGKVWLDQRLGETRQATRGLENQVRESDLARRRAQYVADIRQLPRFLEEHRTHEVDEILGRYRTSPGKEDLRDFVWYHLQHRNHSERRTLTGHRGDVYYVEFSPRGDLLASAGEQGTVLIWETSRWQQVRTIIAGLTDVNVVAFSPDGNTIATADDEGKIKLWEVATGQCQLELLAHAGAAGALFTPDGKTIVTGGRFDGLVKLWDRMTGTMRDSFRAGDGNLECGAFSPDGSTLATVGSDATRLWSWPRRAPIVTLSRSQGGLVATFSHDGRMLATGHAGPADNVVRLWNIADGRLRCEFRGHTAGVTSVAFSADDQTIVSASRAERSGDQAIRLWDVETGTERGVHVGHSGGIWELAVSLDGQTIASAGSDGTVKLWDAEPPPGDGFRLPIPGPPASFGFSPDGRMLIVFEVGPRRWFFSRWDVRSGSLIERRPLNLMGTRNDSAFSHDGRVLAVANEEGKITLCDLTTDRTESIVVPSSGEVGYLEFSPDDTLLKFRRAGPHEAVLVWDRSSRRLIPVPWNADSGSSWTPSQEIFAEISFGDLRRWNPRTGQTKALTPSQRRHLTSPTISADGRFAATIDYGYPQINRWSLDNLKLESQFAGHASGKVSHLALLPDGKTLASAGTDRTVKLWDTTTGEELLMLEGFTGNIWGLRVSPDGKALATISTNLQGWGEIRVWLAAEDEPVPMPGETGGPAK